ncbi:MAG: hypothetical protein LJF04_19470 [Gemmatimonadetes bacterium]|nr:hypothetical protein [Gemmatimonadota bacterium]
MTTRRLTRWFGWAPAALLGFGLALALAAGAPAAGGASSLAALSGAGWLDSLACVGCVAVIVFVSGGTPLGVLALAGAFPAEVLGCLAACVIAAT